MLEYQFGSISCYISFHFISFHFTFFIHGNPVAPKAAFQGAVTNIRKLEFTCENIYKRKEVALSQRVKQN